MGAGTQAVGQTAYSYCLGTNTGSLASTGGFGYMGNNTSNSSGHGCGITSAASMSKYHQQRYSGDVGLQYIEFTGRVGEALQSACSTNLHVAKLNPMIIIYTIQESFVTPHTVFAADLTEARMKLQPQVDDWAAGRVPDFSTRPSITPLSERRSVLVAPYSGLPQKVTVPGVKMGGAAWHEQPQPYAPVPASQHGGVFTNPFTGQPMRQTPVPGGAVYADATASPTHVAVDKQCAFNGDDAEVTGDGMSVPPAHGEEQAMQPAVKADGDEAAGEGPSTSSAASTTPSETGAYLEALTGVVQMMHTQQQGIQAQQQATQESMQGMFGMLGELVSTVAATATAALPKQPTYLQVTCPLTGKEFMLPPNLVIVLNWLWVVADAGYAEPQDNELHYLTNAQQGVGALVSSDETPEQFAMRMKHLGVLFRPILFKQYSGSDDCAKQRACDASLVTYYIKGLNDGELKQLLWQQRKGTWSSEMAMVVSSLDGIVRWLRHQEFEQKQVARDMGLHMSALVAKGDCTAADIANAAKCMQPGGGSAFMTGAGGGGYVPAGDAARQAKIKALQKVAETFGPTYPGALCHVHGDKGRHVHCNSECGRRKDHQPAADQSPRLGAGKHVTFDTHATELGPPVTTATSSTGQGGEQLATLVQAVQSMNTHMTSLATHMAKLGVAQPAPGVGSAHGGGGRGFSRGGGRGGGTGVPGAGRGLGRGSGGPGAGQHWWQSAKSSAGQGGATVPSTMRRCSCGGVHYKDFVCYCEHPEKAPSNSDGTPYRPRRDATPMAIACWKKNMAALGRDTSFAAYLWESNQPQTTVPRGQQQTPAPTLHQVAAIEMAPGVMSDGQQVFGGDLPFPHTLHCAQRSVMLLSLPLGLRSGMSPSMWILQAVHVALTRPWSRWPPRRYRVCQHCAALCRRGVVQHLVLVLAQQLLLVMMLHVRPQQLAALVWARQQQQHMAVISRLMCPSQLARTKG